MVVVVVLIGRYVRMFVETDTVVPLIVSHLAIELLGKVVVDVPVTVMNRGDKEIVVVAMLK